ncbi:MAG: prepilin-type N-terminal cleavage/methylation domain-containing protein [Polyangiales bacterium]|nr:prepilin-type N-terminal cleavage/methylation domain-containing protein [Myxococcales bacterium]
MRLVDQRRRGTARRHRARRGGFTLIELMTVVFIIAISATLAGPAFRGASVERKNGQATLDVLRLFRNARSESIAYGRAHLIRFLPDADGAFRVYRGATSSCLDQVTSLTPNGWKDVLAVGDCDAATTMCIDYVVMNDDDYAIASSTLSVVAVDKMGGSAESNQAIDVCFEPQGTMYWRRAADTANLDIATLASEDSAGALNGGFLFQFTRKDGGVVTGVSRYVALPLGGQARILR